RHYSRDLLTIFPAHRQDCTELDDDCEYLAFLVIEVEQITYQDEMAGRRDRKKFGQTLYDAENQGFEEQKRVHALYPGTIWAPDKANERGQVLRLPGDGA